MTTWDIRAGTFEVRPSRAAHGTEPPGGMCTAMFYEELMAEPRLADVHSVAVTLPGHGGTPAPADVSMENYARLMSELARP